VGGHFLRAFGESCVQQDGRTEEDGVLHRCGKDDNVDWREYNRKERSTSGISPAAEIYIYLVAISTE